jgi:acyl-CoA thioester hydrolase
VVTAAETTHDVAAAPYVVDVALRFRDIDQFGHVNHAQYLSFCEEHRTSFFDLWLDECGVDVMDRGFVVAHVSCDYAAPLGRDDPAVRVEMTVESVGRTSLRLRYRIVNRYDSIMAVVRYVLVLVDTDSQSRPLTPAEQRMLARFAGGDDA